MKLRTTDGRRFAFLKRFVIPCPSTGENYLTRWRIIHTPWFGILLHRIDAPDPDSVLHDHPWDFTSIVLVGGYVEEFQTSRLATRAITQVWYRGSRHRMLTASGHRILRLHRTPTWTLVLAGPRIRDWGFWGPEGWVYWKDWLGEHP